MEPKLYIPVIKAALAEDLGTEGDITSAVLFADGERSVFRLLSKDCGVLCGIEVFHSVFAELDPLVSVETYMEDGAELKPGEWLLG